MISGNASFSSSMQMLNINFVNFVLSVVSSALLNSEAFHVSLLACSLEVVMADKGSPCMSCSVCVALVHLLVQ